MRLIDAFRNVVEADLMAKPARWAIVYESPEGQQFVGGLRSVKPSAEITRAATHFLGRPLLILKVKPK